jgi:hypothetical protein
MQTITAKEIHADFYGAEERLFVEAIGISKGTLGFKPDKAARLQKIGFGKAKPIKDAEDYHRKRGVSEKLISAIEYYRTYYPQYKFITEGEVKKLCSKYGLLLGEASNFTADMPDKNLQDIEKFKLRKEDWREKSSLMFRWFEPNSQPADLDVFGGFASAQRRRSGSSMFDYDGLIAQYYALATSQLGVSEERDGGKKKKEKEKEYEQPAFKICAPKEDFDTRGFEVREGYKLVYDPIVLQPVSYNEIEGYLIVTAWGDEASDELVVNQIQN